MRRWMPALVGLTVLIGAGCPGTDQAGGRFPYQAFVDAFGIAGDVDPTGQTGGAAAAAETVFRQPLTLRFQNFHNRAILDTSFVAWVDLSSIRDREQEDELFRGGYVQLTSEVRLGTAFTLPPGTFVYGGTGTAGATAVTLEPATGGTPDVPTEGEDDDGEDEETRTASVREYELITPDAILVFSQPPVSCDSVAFIYRDPISREVLSGAATGSGGFKTYAQVDVYECEPFRPGVFLRRIGATGPQSSNEYFEGQTIDFSFTAGAIVGTDGAFCSVTIGQESADLADGGDGDEGGG